MSRRYLSMMLAVALAAHTACGRKPVRQQKAEAPAVPSLATDGKTPPAGATNNLPAPTAPDEVARKYRAFLAANGVITLPSAAGWKAGFANVSLFGLLLTALLLSLGAPFWYSALGNLLQLRSVLAIKDDAQRQERQTTDLPPKTPGSGEPPTRLGGGRGDLAALG